MKRWLWGMSVVALGLSSMKANAVLIDTIAAMVDDEVILRSEIRIQIIPKLRELSQSGITEAEYEQKADRLLKEALKESIEAKILYREAVRMAVEIHDSEVEEIIDRYRKTFDTEEEFMADLDEQGESLSDYRERMRKMKMAQIMARSKTRALSKEVVISEADVAAYYDEHKDSYVQPERIHLRQIMLPARRNTDERTQAIAKLSQLRTDIVAGADFETLAKEHSQNLGAANGGIIGWMKQGDLDSAIENVAFALADGAVSEVVETPLGVYLLRVDEREVSTTQSLTEVRSSIEPELRAQIASTQYDKWMDTLRRHSNVRVYIN